MEFFFTADDKTKLCIELELCKPLIPALQRAHTVCIVTIDVL